jgi:nucleoside-diphosphate-sugar epimerase
MHVSDVASAFVDVLESGVKGPVNIASGKPVLIKNVIYTIAEHLNGSDKLRLGALPAQNEPAVLTADVSRLQNEVGFVSKFELELGLKQTIDWWKKTLLEQTI